MSSSEPDHPAPDGDPICEPTVIPSSGIGPSQIDPDALKVVRRLQRFGHAAYLVGGCVRDVLLKRVPKDFDVVTSAKPQEVRKLFRNCRLIGRRFRLAHIHFRGKIIETATFRAAADPQADGDLLIRSDNVFGTEADDAFRRDFTVNALFYDPVERVLIDYVGGMEDLASRTLRFIGDPAVRVQEDPVRILRAIKFAARLGFTVEPGTWQAVVAFRQELVRSAPPRLLEEIVRMLRSRGAEQSFRLLWTSGVLEVLLPELACYLSRALVRGEERDPGAGMWAYLKVLDRSEREVETNAVLLAALLLHTVEDACDPEATGYELKIKSHAPGDVARVLVRRLIERLRLPKRDAERIQQLVSSQRRLFKLRRDQPLPKALMRRAYFPEALDLFEIGVTATRRGRHTLNRLRSSFSGDGSVRHQREQAEDPAAGEPRRRRRKRSRSSGRRRPRRPAPDQS